MLSNKLIFFCVCLASISLAHALVRQRPLIGGFIPIDDLSSDLVKEASHEAIKVWNKKTSLKNYFNMLGENLAFLYKSKIF
jgi:hypothetical protein